MSTEKCVLMDDFTCIMFNRVTFDSRPYINVVFYITKYVRFFDNVDKTT